jgi:excisionase family DNA binding protein
MPPAGEDPSLVGVREVADQLGVDPETIRRLVHDGRLDAVRVGARQRVKPSRFQARSFSDSLDDDVRDPRVGAEP